MNPKLKKILLARPNDMKIYRDSNATGLTAILYELPWSVTWTIMLVLAAICWMKR
jgi:hypothetical protein